MRLSPRCKNIIAGSAEDIGAVAVRACLTPPSWLYGALVQCRNTGYDRSLLTKHNIESKVLCVGNITVGGTGKTPVVIALAQLLRSRFPRIAVVSRGYQGTENDSDEVRLLRQALPHVAVVVDSDRVRGGHTAIDKHQAQLIILDDGFQHRRLARDVDIVLIDCTCPFGFGHVLPRGLLREPLKNLRRASGIILTRCNLVSDAQCQQIEQRVKDLTAVETPVFRSQHRPLALLDGNDQPVELSALTAKRVAAVSGIGNPAAFTAGLEKLGAEVAQVCAYDDHYEYTAADTAKLAEPSAKVDMVITTEKDWVKLRRLENTAQLQNLYRLQIELTFDRPDELTAWLNARL